MRVHSTISGGLATLDMLDGLPQELAFTVVVSHANEQRSRTYTATLTW